MATIDLSQLPAPNVVEPLDYETLFAERKATLISLYPADQQEAVARTLALESEPIVKLLQENAYREVLLRQRVNDAAKAVMLAHATGEDLDQLGANFNTPRLVIAPADEGAIPPTPAVMEADEDYRLRLQDAFEGMSTAGSAGSYRFHARSADGRVADVTAISPSPANVIVTVLSRDGDGSASAELLQVVSAALNDEDVRPVADRVIVQSAKIAPYVIEAVLYLYPGPEVAPILTAAKQRLHNYVLTMRRLGRSIRRSGIIAALTVEGVERVEVAQPATDIVLDKTQAGYCTGVNITPGRADD
ncbi:Baseplate J-like protein [Serratia liquefaciens]|uniref:baseplate assembly protein n=1 Tax=Serratia liquefaciens TaxID=614 RepID=UPI00217AF36B|nr:baseplate assembly protein [Serratia liquefaciens]CAI1571771.1 Baseplate J-like protein [Serratia liquefaciens]HDS8358609.1 baseplate assembly protein [Serratia liquefaciens]